MEPPRPDGLPSMPERFLNPLVCWLALCGAALPSHALDFGAGTSSAVLGAPLAFEVALKLAPGEDIEPRCLAADVAMGGAPLPASAVSVGLRRGGGESVVLVRTAYVVHEPVVAVVISVGCPARLTRRFTVLADPPAASAVGVLPAWPGDVSTVGAAARPVPIPARAATEPRRPAGAAIGQAPGAMPAAGAAALSEPAPAARSLGEGRPRLEVGAPVIRPAEAARTAPGATAPAAGSGVAGPPAAPSAAAPVPAAPPAAAPVPAEGTSAPLTAASAPGAAASDQARVQALETSLVALRVESRQQRESLARLESALAAAESQARIAWLAAALLGVLASAATVLWLRRARGEPVAGGRWQAAWPAAAARSPAEPSLGVAEARPPGAQGRPDADGLTRGGEPALQAEPVARAEAPPRPAVAAGDVPAQGDGRSLPLEPAEDADESAVERTSLMAPSSASVSAPLHVVSIEEVLDLEQQVEFLTVLGREDGAVDLLVEHLRKTGGTHPTPFLKLMEIHRRRGEREAYERVRARFNQRFNAVAAAFGAAPAPARALQDDPALMQRIERAWARPLDAMTLLENLMFRGEGREPLGMAALEEVVFLHALARDLDRHAGRPAILVDVLLPLEDTVTAGDATVDASSPVADQGRVKAPKRRRAAATGGLRVRDRQAQGGAPTKKRRGPDAAAPVDVLLEDVGRPAVSAFAPPAAPTVASDPWPSISDTAFDVGGLEMEPLRPPPGGRSPRGSS